MSAAKHTPRPWEAKPPRIGAAITVYAERSGIYREVPIATTCSNTSPATMEMHRSGEVAANARLIAAAPELLEALQVFAERSSSEEFITITVRTAHVERARAAIAKATGGSPCL